MKWYTLSIKELIAQFETNAKNGLSEKEAAYRLQLHGENVLPEKPTPSLFLVFLTQFQNPLIYILLIAAGIILLLGDPLDASIISGVLFFNAILGAIQEGRTQNILASLKQFVLSDSIVIRDGKRMVIPDKELVPGDIIVLQEGEKIGADARLVEANNVLVDEAFLTGESIGVRKNTEIMADELPIHDQHNMLFRGSYVLSGLGKALVIGTGTHTEIAQLGAAVEKIETETPLKRSLDRLSRYILLFILIICSLMFVYGLLIGKPLTELLVMLTALFICVIPEGLPVVFTLTLVTGAYRMAKKHVLIKRLQAVEGLGRTNTIIIDKTGTLTRNEMMVSIAYADGKLYRVTGQGYRITGNIFSNDVPLQEIDQLSELKLMGHAAVLLGKAEIEYVQKLDLFHVKGDPTEAALQIFAHKLGFYKNSLLKMYIKRDEVPFSSETKWQAGIFTQKGNLYSFIIGAPEVIFARSTNITDADRLALDKLLEQGLRVIACAYKEGDVLTNNLIFLGILGIQDTIRQEVKETVTDTRNAGLRLVMATGDHKETAEYIATQVGMLQPNDLVIDGSELNIMNDQELAHQLSHATVFSRVTPEQKIRIVHAFQKRGDIVAMTGDGVNDAPSLVAADLGIAMGNIGTEVAKQAADIILLDDSFNSLIDGIKEGRNIFYALRRVILYFFATNLGEVLVVLFALILNLPLPIGAAQILWLNLVTDGFLDVALSMEQQEKGLLQHIMPKDNRQLLDWALFLKTFYMAIPMGIGSLLIFYYYAPFNLEHARSMTLVTMAMFQWFNAWNCRSERLSNFQLNFFANKWLLAATALVFGLQILVLHNRFMQFIFKTVPISFNQWLLVIVIASPIFFLEELRKFITQRYFNRT